MIGLIKHIIKIALIFALIICWGISLGYANNIGSKENTINFYFENDNFNVESIKLIEESKKDLSLVGWKEESSQVATNPDLNRNANELNVLLIHGPSNLIVKGSMLFKDDKEGCLIDRETAFKLFGSDNVLGKTIVYGGRSFVVRGILKGSKANIMIQLPEGLATELDGLIIDGTEFSLNKTNEFKAQFGIQEMPINGGIYYILAKVVAMIFPILALIVILIKILISAFKSRNKPILLGIYVIMSITSIFIVFKVTKIQISIPLDIIPNKWSDFDFWSNMWKDYSDKIQYVMYMKKSTLDIYNIEHLLKSILFSMFTIVLFIINLKVIKISNIKELLINNIISIICTFITVLYIWSKFNFDVNLTMLWLIYPLYLCADYFMNIHYKHLIYDEEVEFDNNENLEDEAFC